MTPTSDAGAESSTSTPSSLPLFSIDQADRTLLTFVLQSDDDLDGWNEWRRLIALEDIAGDTHELIPALYKRLEGRYDGPEMGRLRGIYRFHWTRSQQHQAGDRAISNALSSARIDHLGPADRAAGGDLDEPGILPLRQPRVTVRYEESGAALRALAAAGWSVERADRGARALRARLVQTEWQLTDGEGREARLVNHYNPAFRDRVAERVVWERSLGTVGGSERLASAEDRFLASLSDAIAHQGALRWAIATVAIARAGNGLDALDAMLRAPVVQFALPVLESRLAFLMAAVDVPLLDQALEAIRGARSDANSVGTGSGTSLPRAAATPVHLALAAPRLIGRYGGLRGTWRYLRSAR